MGALDLQEIARLINHSRTTNISLSPIKTVAGRWSLHRGEHKVHTSAYSFTVLYFQSGATLQDVRAALRQVSSLPDTHVVYAQSLDRMMRHHSEVGALLAGAKGVWTAKEYLVSFIKDELQSYLAKLTDQAPPYYVDPRVETPSGIPIKVPNPLQSFLCDPDTASSAFGGKLAILLAEPGQGKTYMSRHLVARLARAATGSVPLMVDSSQWHSLSVDDQGSLPKTIAHSFRHFDAPIGWLDGHEEEFLQATLRADVFRIVFDGFDEYILRNRGSVQPIEVLEAIARLASSTGTRIIITSRTAFWHTNLSDAQVEEFLQRTGSLVYEIQPFDREQAKQYFRSRMHDEGNVDQAIQIYTNLSKQNAALVGRGFVLSLVADLAERGKVEGEFNEGGSGALLWLMNALCEREVLRQKLPFSAAEQLAVLGTFATETARGAAPNTELLQLAMSEIRPNLDGGSLEKAIDKIKSHPLLEKKSDADVWRFKQDQIGVLLLADQLVGMSSDRLARFVSTARLDGGASQDVGTMIVDLIRGQRPEEGAVLRLEEICKTLCSPAGKAAAHAFEGSRLAAIISLIAVERFLPRGSGSHQDRTSLLLRICGPSSICGLSFTGTIARYDLREVVFDGCRFERVTWANCKFDESTTFRICHFLGGIPPAHCEGFASVRLLDCRLDPEAETIFNSERVREGKRKYSLDDLQNDLRGALNKFLIKGGMGLKTVSEPNLRKGQLGASRYRDEILEALGATVIEEHAISGGPTGYNVRADAVEAVKFYAANNVFTGGVREAFDRLRVKLGLP